MFGGIYYWFDKITGVAYNEILGQIHFWIFFIGVNLTFFPMHFLGVAGMPRRVVDYPDAFYAYNKIASWGSYISAWSVLIFFFMLYEAFFSSNQKVQESSSSSVSVDSAPFPRLGLIAVSGFLFINIYLWGGDAGDVLGIPNPASRFQHIQFFFYQLLDAESSYIITFLYIILGEFMVVFSVLVFVFLCLFHEETQSFFVTTFTEQYKILPTKNKMLLGFFTIYYGIPNKIFINHGLHIVLHSSIVIVIFLLSIIIPFLNLFIFFGFLCAIESYLFAVFYEENEKFKNFVLTYLFHNNSDFAESYFAYFWGNMKKASEMAVKSGVAGAVVREIWNSRVANEELLADQQADRNVRRAISLSEHKSTPEEIMAMYQTEKSRIKEAEAPFTNFEKDAKKAMKDMFDKMTSSKKD